MQRVALGALAPFITAPQVMGVAGIEQVVGMPEVVQRNCDAALVLAGRFAAGVVERQAEPRRETLAPVDNQITGAGPGAFPTRGLDLDIRFRCWRSLEILQSLLDVAQVEQIARLRRHGTPGVGQWAAAWRDPYGIDDTGNERQDQPAAVQVLGFSQDSGGDEASGDDGILNALDAEVDATRAQATPQRGVMGGIGRAQGPLKILGALADQLDFINAKTGCF